MHIEPVAAVYDGNGRTVRHCLSRHPEGQVKYERVAVEEVNLSRLLGERADNVRCLY